MGKKNRQTRRANARRDDSDKKPDKKPARRPPSDLPIEDPNEIGPVTVRFLGGAQTTTGSLHRVRTPHGDILLDCGMYQGHRAESERWNRDLPVDVDRIKAMLLSHGHIDHCGALPNLVRKGYRGLIFCTSATADLLPIMLLDAAHIQESDTERMNRRLAKKGHPLREPLFTVADAERTLTQVQGIDYGKPFEPVKDVEVRFVDAGHIIGSAAVHLTIRADGKETTLGFTGDLGRADVPILRDPEPLGQVDWLLTESTYGDRDHEDTGNLLSLLERFVNGVAPKGGKVIIPSFAVGRTQLVLFLLHQLRSADRIPDIPFFVDSPMASRATDVFRKNQDLYDDEAHQFLMNEGPLFHRARTTFVGPADESRKLNTMKGPAVIIASSGMCEGGRILHHLKHHATDSRNVVLFVGYQAAHTLGRRILEGEKKIKVYGDRVQVRAKIDKINGLSAHADRNGLVRYVERLDGEPKKVFCVHGEPEKIAALRSFFYEHDIRQTAGPKPGEWHRLL